MTTKPDLLLTALSRAGIGRWMAYYNGSRPHSALGGHMPEEVHQGFDGIRLAA